MSTAAHDPSQGEPTSPATLGAMAWVTSSACCVTALAFVVQRASMRFAGAGVAPWLRSVAAPSLFLLAVSSLTLAVSRLTRHPPVGRSTVLRWTADSAVFAATAIALLLLLTWPFGGDAGWHALPSSTDLAGTLLPPLTEELSFRGMLAAIVASSLTAAVTSHRVRAVLTILICSAAFSVAHENAQSAASWYERFAPRFGAGVVLGALARRSTSLLPPMLAHAAYNALARSC